MILYAAGAVLIAAVKRVVRIIGYLPKGAAAVFWVVFILPLPSQAHEFWIEPSSFQPDPGQSLTADLLIGTDFLGASAIYVPDQIETFALLGTGPKSQSERYEITGRYGDRPAGKMASGSPGLRIIVHQTAPIRLTYSDAKKFDEFAREKGFDDALNQHQGRGLPLDKITERYQRYAKSLIAVGGPEKMGAGQDRHLGLAIELVAEANPYQWPPLQSMPVRVYADGAPLASAQITVFTRHNPRHVEKAKYQTDKDGRSNFLLLAGRDYLVDSVILRPMDGAIESGDVMWESIWASLTFQVPANPKM
ncbi:MAG: DUF4198 domain-containing protein [Candidatus Puniceispirillum sp.]|jgi:uncharacterized GH25 family protein